MELILVRHAQPAWSTPDGLNRNDPGLTELGHAQAARLAERFADPVATPTGGPIDRLLHSTANRARETAQPIAAALGVEPEPRDWLWEIRPPEHWEGQPLEAVEAAFETLRHRPTAEMWEGIDGMESFHDFHERIVGGLTGTLRELGIRPTFEPGMWSVSPEAPDRLVLVAHGGTNSTIMSHLLGLHPEPFGWLRLVMGHASVAVLATTPLAGSHVWSLHAIGDAHHLERAHRTA